jgi:hypothetical protein
MIGCAAVPLAASALAVSALHSTEAEARPVLTSPACSEPALETRSDPQPRPAYPEGARQLAGTRVVVHHAIAGPNAPPSVDKLPANGIPDYVEKVRDAADAALAFFAKPDVQGQPFQGFDTTFVDVGGPDQRLDIYIRAQRPLGRAVPPTRGEGGAFVVLSNTLADRSRESRQRFKGDSIRFTVSHELFHIVQFNYVPAGMPLWVAEATANTLAFFFENVDHPVIRTLAFDWLKRPECALWFEGHSCDRCYGGIWWWVLHPYIIRLYFEHLALHAGDRFGVGRGLGALEAAYEGLAPSQSGSFVTPYFFLDFAFTFAPSAAAVSYSHPKIRPRFTTSIVARPDRKTNQLTLNPLSANYIAVRAPSRARGLELVTAGVDGPDPLQTLLLGAERRPSTSARFTRQVASCVTTFVPAYASFADRIAVNFRSARERRRSLLVVANRTNRVVHYTITYQALSRPALDPSPNDAWSKRYRGLPRNTFCAKDVYNAAGSDAANDEEAGAPDLTESFTSLTSTRGNSRPFVSFAVAIPNRRELQTDDLIILWIDTDRNSKTGCAPFGAERAFVIAGLPGPDVSRLGRCQNGDISLEGNQGSFQARFDESKRRLVIVATTSDLAGASAFNFLLFGSWRDVASGEVRGDWAPDLGFAYCFPACVGAADGIATQARPHFRARPSFPADRSAVDHRLLSAKVFAGCTRWRDLLFKPPACRTSAIAGARALSPR